LRGTTGTSEIEVNVVGREIREINRNPGNAGKKLKLTVDAELQQFMQHKLIQKKSASAVIMDVSSGAIYALASSPAFDPNKFTRRLSAEAWEDLLANPGHPLNNKAVGGQYPPGSTFKMITAIAAMEAGVTNKYNTAHCPGHYDYGGDRFHCWKKDGHGTVNLHKAITESCDVYFYKIATEIGIQKISDMARKMGLGQRFGFELKEERPGLMPDKNWKFGHFRESYASQSSQQKHEPPVNINKPLGQGQFIFQSH